MKHKNGILFGWKQKWIYSKKGECKMTLRDAQEGKEYIIGSCKYRNETIGVDELELLKHYATVFGKGKKYHYYIFFFF